MTRARSCYLLSDEIRAACLALLEEGKTQAECSVALRISPASVYEIRRKAGMPAAKRGSSHKRMAELPEEAHCPRCGLRGEHECLPYSAVAYLGRRDEPVCAALGW